MAVINSNGRRVLSMDRARPRSVTGTALRRLTALASVLATCYPQPGFSGDPGRGQTLYESRCIACHSLNANRVGPKHRGVFGRQAGTAAGFDYSPALQQSRIVWDTSTLDRWLSNPEALIPGQRMNFRVDSEKDRLDIIAYLKEHAE